MRSPHWTVESLDEAISACSVAQEVKTRAARACARNIRTALSNAIAAGLDESVVEKLRALTFEIEAARDETTGDLT